MQKIENGKKKFYYPPWMIKFIKIISTYEIESENVGFETTTKIILHGTRCISNLIKDNLNSVYTLLRKGLDV